MTVLRSIHFAADRFISVFLMAEQDSIAYLYHVFLIHSSVNGHLGCSHALDIIKSAALNTEVYVSFQIVVFSGYVTRNGIVGHMVPLFLVF